MFVATIKFRNRAMYFLNRIPGVSSSWFGSKGANVGRTTAIVDFCVNVWTCLERFGFASLLTWTIIINYNLYGGKAPVTRSDFQGGPLRVKIKIHQG